MELSNKALQGSTPALLRVQYPTLGKSFRLPVLLLTSAKVKTTNISFTSPQLPGQCLGRDLIIENAKSCFYGKNKAGRDYWSQIYLGKICCSELSSCPGDQIHQTTTLCKHFLASLRMSPAAQDGWAPEEGAAAKSAQWLKVNKLSCLTQCNMRELFGMVKHSLFYEMLLGWVALFGHFVCSKSSFGRVRAGCWARLPCPAAGGGVQTRLKNTHQRESVITVQPRRAAGQCWGGSGVEGKLGGAAHATFPDPLETSSYRDSLWAHPYFSYFIDCSFRRAMSGRQI